MFVLCASGLDTPASLPFAHTAILTIHMLGFLPFVLAFFRKRHRAIDALGPPEQALHAIIEHAPAGIVVHQDGKVVYANQLLLEMLGYDVLDEVVGRPVLAFVHPDLREQTSGNIENILGGKNTVGDQSETKLLCRDGSSLDVTEIVHQITYNKKPAIQAYLLNNTARKQAEEALRQSEERFRKFFEWEPCYCYMVSATGEMLNVNRAALAVLGYTKEELIGRPVSMLYPPESRERVKEFFEHWKRTGKLEGAEVEIVTKTGERRTVLLSADAVMGGDGRLLHSISVQQDITARKSADRALEESEKRYRTIFATSGAATMIIDPDSTIRLLNTEAERLLAVPKGESEGAVRWIDFVVEDDVEQMWRCLREFDTAPSNAKEDHEIRVKDRQGNVHDVRASLAALPGTTQLVVSLVEISEQKRAVVDLSRRLEEQMVLHAVAMAGTEATTLDALIERSTVALGTLLFPDKFGIGIVDDETGDISIHRSVRGLTPTEREIRIPRGKGVAGRVVATMQSSRIPDTSRDPAYFAIGSSEMRSELCVPIKAGDHVIGIINAESKHAGAFSEADERLLQILAGQLATGMERLRLMEAERRRAETLDALRATMTDILGELESSKLLEVIVERACALLQTSGGELGIFNKDEDVLRIVVSHHTAKDYTGTRMELDEGAMGRVVVTGEPLIVPDYQTWEGRSRQFDGGLWHALLVVPLEAGGELLGALAVGDVDPDRAFGPEDLQLLSMFAQQAAIAVANATLFEEVQELAVRDPLTGLYNRRYFFELAQREVIRAQRYTRPLSMLMLDIDHFKVVNDKHGHHVGDEVLREIAHRCSKGLREIDLVGRYGGEEFVFLLPETDGNGGARVAEQVRREIVKPIKTSGPRSVAVTVSVGVATLDDSANDVFSVLERADTALYAAKRVGRNRVEVWNS